MSFKRNCFLCVLCVLCDERKGASAAFALLMVGMLVLAAAVAVLPLPAQAYVSQGESGDTLGYWRFNTKDSTPDDSGGRSNTATMHNMELADYITGKFGYGLDFDGDNDYLSAGTTDFSSSAGTHETWVNFDDWASGNTETIFSAPSEMPNTDTGLVGHWRMNEGGSTSTTADVSGEGNTGTLYYGSGGDHTSYSDMWTTGRFDDGIDFDGTDDYVDAGSNTVLDNLGSFTVSAWVKPFADSWQSGWGTYYGAFAAKGNTFSEVGWEANVHKSSTGTKYALHFSRVFSTTHLNYRSTEVLNVGEWYHLATVYYSSTQTAKLYINGIEVTYSKEQEGVGSVTDDSAETLQFGHRGPTDDNAPIWLKGIIDEVRIYNKVLSADEVRSHYLGGISMHKNSGNNLVFHAGNAVLTHDVSGLSGWHHVAGTYASNDARLWLDGKQVAQDTSVTVTSNLNFDSSCYFANDEKNAMNFSGVMDEVRVLNYAKTGFGGGVVVNEVCYTPSAGVEWIELHNHGSGTVDCENWLFEDSNSGHSYEVPAGINYEIASGNFVVIYLNTTANTDSSIAWYTCNGVGGNNTLDNGDLNTTDSIAVYDLDPDNDGDNENSKGKECMVDFAAWGADAGGADDNAVSAGIWTSATYVINTDKNSIYLKADGNNDEAVSDWAARNESTPGYPVPELPTAILFAVGLVVLVGYVYVVRRRRRQ